MPITAIRSMPTLDVTKLTQAQLDKAEQIFEDHASPSIPASQRGPITTTRVRNWTIASLSKC